MSVDLRLPNITGATPQERQAQMESYMHQFVEQLQWALNSIDMVQANGTYTVVSKGGAALPSSQASSRPADTLSIFATLKPLIIKSADIVNAYYETLKERYDGLYVAESDFGVYAEQTSQEIEKNSTNINQAFTNVQVVETNLQEAKTGLYGNITAVVGEVGNLDNTVQDTKAGIEAELEKVSDTVGGVEKKVDDSTAATAGSIKNLEDALEAVNTYIQESYANIKTGLLYEDDSGVGIYGIEVGQTVVVNGEEYFNKYARFTADRLSFYDNNNIEVAYIGDYKLYIRNAEITESLKIGGLVNIVLANGNVVEKWVGKGEAN